MGGSFIQLCSLGSLSNFYETVRKPFKLKIFVTCVCIQSEVTRKLIIVCSMKEIRYLVICLQLSR